MAQYTRPIPNISESCKTRFYSKISTVPTETGCLEWLASKKSIGYGSFVIRGVKIGAHRVAYFLATGTDPGELCVCHRCDNPSCCNPRHLFLGTHADNVRDMIEKGRGNQPLGEAHGMAKLTAADIPLIRSDPRTSRVIAPDYGVAYLAIECVKLRRTWKHIA